MERNKYVLITPARNEECYIEKTIQSVIHQTILPEKWIVVSDGSTDTTDEIISRYAEEHTFIQLVTRASADKHNFGSKVKAIEQGYNRLKNVDYGFVGNLDADISFDPEYFQNILEKFGANHKLGIAGGVIQELVNGKYLTQNISLNSVAGAVQLFRRQCYESIGGYIPMEYGGIDAAAEILARSNGWEVKTFLECKVLHHRRVTTGRNNIMGTRFYQGLANYQLGYHPFFHLLSSLCRILDRPIFIGSIATIGGYYWGYFRKFKRILPEDAVHYLRAEQKIRLRSLF